MLIFLSDIPAVLDAEIAVSDFVVILNCIFINIEFFANLFIGISEVLQGLHYLFGDL
ncbi:hypothetical protein ACK2M7_00255 [Chryseobacterium sp. TY4]